MFGPHDEVILPPSQLQWLSRQPDNVASSHAAQNDAIQLEHSLGYKFAWDAWGGLLIKSDLNSALETVCAVMNDEVGPAVDAAFGVDVDEWKELDLFPACRIITGRATQRFTLGDSAEGRRLCKDDGFIQSCYSVLDGMLEVAGYVAASPMDVLKPLVARYASRVMKAKLKDLKDRFEPVYRERMQIIRDNAQGKETKEPRDLIQMMLQYASKERPNEANNIDDITKRLALSNFGTMHQSVITLHNFLLNIIDSDAEFNTTAVLRAEIASVIGPDAGSSTKHWTRAQVASMTRADSAARETLRLHSFIGRTVQRLSVVKEGITTPDGVHLPYGTMVSILAHQAQTDADIVGAEPEKYDPFRFSRTREAAAASTADGRTGRHRRLCDVLHAGAGPWPQSSQGEDEERRETGDLDPVPGQAGRGHL